MLLKLPDSHPLHLLLPREPILDCTQSMDSDQEQSPIFAFDPSQAYSPQSNITYSDAELESAAPITTFSRSSDTCVESSYSTYVSDNAVQNESFVVQLPFSMPGPCSNISSTILQTPLPPRTLFSQDAPAHSYLLAGQDKGHSSSPASPRLLNHQILYESTSAIHNNPAFGTIYATPGPAFFPIKPSSIHSTEHGSESGCEVDYSGLDFQWKPFNRKNTR
ncbi:hypothetical protein BDQ17DRAFT_1367955 [Cyathus striatus]|nr:hypothetical protein BDQ17DRAFT_1367955 [Cyathus striatus]